jgi:hypothetical protein
MEYIRKASRLSHIDSKKERKEGVYGEAFAGPQQVLDTLVHL